MKEVERKMRHTKWKFNNEKDFIDYCISYYCEETIERIHKAFSKLTDEIGEILEDDRAMHEKNAVIQGEE